MPEAAFKAVVAKISAVLAEIPDVRVLTPRELVPYGPRAEAGWAVPSLCTDPALQLRVLLPKAAPYAPPRVAVYPAPPPLAWPHLEELGLLCLVSDAANVSITAPESVVVTLLDEARRLVNSSIAGENIQDFEEEFTSYWERWDRTTGTVNILCDPRPPSRQLVVWYSTHGAYVAENESVLRSWLSNRFGEDVVRKPKLWAAPLLWLPRALRPAEYPTTINALRADLHEDPLRRRLLDEALLQPEPQNKLIVLGMQTRRGVAFAGVDVRKPAGLQKGFSHRPPDEIVLGRYGAAPITGARALRFDPSWVHGRDHNPECNTLRGKRVLLIGVGSLGSSVADLLVKAGVGSLTCIDPETLASGNSSRHLLGAPDVGAAKAVAVTHSLARRFPHVTTAAIAKSLAEDERTIGELRAANLIVSLSGNWSAESLLDALWRDDGALAPVVYGWIEPHAGAGHALLLRHGTGCLRCLLDDKGKPRVPVTRWPDDTLLQVPACGELFQPYGATELAHGQALVAELVLDALLDRVPGSHHRAWIGRRDLVLRSGGDWNPEWITLHGDPGLGGKLLEVDFNCGQCCGE